MDSTSLTAHDRSHLYKLAFGLAIFTILYNIGEGLFLTYFDYDEESLALFGFSSADN